MSTAISDLGDEPAVAERFELIRRMAEDLAHELKNPLNAVVINLEVLRTRVRGGQADAASERIDVIEKEVRRLHTLLDHTLRLVRADQQTGPFAVDELLAEVELLGGVLAKLERREFTCTPAGEGVYAQGGREQLRFALLWLVDAALHGSSEAGAEIRLRAKPGEALQLWLSSPRSGADALRGAVPRARRLLAGSRVTVAGVEELEAEARVQLTVPVAGYDAHAITGNSSN